MSVSTLKVLGEGISPDELALESVAKSIPQWRGHEIRYGPVSGGLSNSNWVVSVPNDQRRYFVKIPGKGTEIFVNRSVANATARHAHAAGLGPEVIYFDDVSGIEVCEFLDGYRPSTNADFLDQNFCRRVVDIYKALHAEVPVNLSKTIFDMIDEHYEQIHELNAPTPADFDWLTRQYRDVKAAFASSGIDIVQCFNDPMPGNFLVGASRDIKLIDYEFSSGNERTYDLAVWFGEMFFAEDTSAALAECYFGARTDKHLARINTMRSLADLKWACWSMIQCKISALNFDFYKYGAWKFMRARTLMHDPRWPLWLQKI